MNNENFTQDELNEQLPPLEPITIACPKCDGTDVDMGHAGGCFAHPEVFYFYCSNCDHQWGFE